jgi:hypothetical protein
VSVVANGQANLRGSGQDFFRFIVPQLLDLFSRNASASLRAILDKRPLLMLDQQHSWVVDSDSYEEVSFGSPDWPRIERAIVSAVERQAKHEAGSLRDEAIATYTALRELEYLSPEIARMARGALPPLSV